MLNRVSATPGQIEKLTNKYVLSKNIKFAKVTYDQEDNIYFMHVTLVGMFGMAVAQWQVRNGTPMFFSLQKEKTSYDINYKDEHSRELFEFLKKLGDKKIEDYIAGNSL